MAAVGSICRKVRRSTVAARSLERGWSSSCACTAMRRACEAVSWWTTMEPTLASRTDTWRSERRRSWGPPSGCAPGLLAGRPAGDVDDLQHEDAVEGAVPVLRVAVGEELGEPVQALELRVGLPPQRG